MNFIQTRGDDGLRPSEVTFSQAILNPSASFGGLYVPKELPRIDAKWLNEAKNLSYKQLCLKILNLFALDIDEDVIKEALDLYDHFDDPNDPVPLVKLDTKTYVNELYHGPTRAFKDMALQPFGYILSHLAQKNGQKYLILAATSGDTGPATLDTFKNRENINVVCIYPDGGTSDVQRLQMVTNDATNEKIVGIYGNFDDAQKALKTLLNSSNFKETLKSQNISLSAANSVNFGRIIFQIIYHFSAYLKLLNSGDIQKNERIYLSIPSGNFGNALGAYYAKKMGLPVEKILVASNINNILTDLLTKGKYDISGRTLLKTTSPAMDILISSNVERLLYDKFGSKRTKELMEDLQKNKRYNLSKEELDSLQEDFSACFCDDKFVDEMIQKSAKNGYILDPHTATCLKTKELTNKPLINVIASTAEWTKFAPTMYNAIKDKQDKIDDEKALNLLQKSHKLKIPQSISDLFSKNLVHKEVIDANTLEQTIIKFLKDRA